MAQHYCYFRHVRKQKLTCSVWVYICLCLNCLLPSLLMVSANAAAVPLSKKMSGNKE